jgi:hypothetical protein
MQETEPVVQDRAGLIVEHLAQVPGLTAYEIHRWLARAVPGTVRTGRGSNDMRELRRLQEEGRVRSERQPWPNRAGFRTRWYAVTGE